MKQKIPVNLIAAMAKNRVIGKDNKMPWHLPADLQHFKQVTMRHPIIMGRKTFESIGRPLPGRRNIVISRNQNLSLDGAEVFHSIQEALDSCHEDGAEEIMIIGGSNLYSQTLDLADRLYLTFIDLDVAGDAHFPDWQHLSWQEIARETHSPDEKNAYNYEFVTLERIAN